MKLEEELYDFIVENGPTEVAELCEMFSEQGYTRERVKKAFTRNYNMGRIYDLPKGTCNALPGIEYEEEGSADIRVLLDDLEG